MGVSCRLCLLIFVGLTFITPRRTALYATEQTCSAGTICTWSFDFGTGKPHQGYTQVQSATAFTAQLGYGFLSAPTLQASDRGICSDGKPFLSTAEVPEGNYDVTIELGGDTESTTTGKA